MKKKITTKKFGGGVARALRRTKSGRKTEILVSNLGKKQKKMKKKDFFNPKKKKIKIITI